MIQDDELNKQKRYYNILVGWINIHHREKTIEQYFIEKGLKSIAIYGMAELGELLYDELFDTEIKIKYVIDKCRASVYAEVPVFSPEDELEEVDAIIITAVHYYDEICETLVKKIDCPMISLDSVIHSLNY